MKTIMLWILLLAGPLAFAQKNDYLVKVSGDTLYGDIRFEKGRFLVDNAGQVDAYPAKEIRKVKSVHVKNSIVVPCNLHFYTDNIQDLEVKNYRDMNRDTVMILDEVYTTPKMNLYWGTDEYKSQYYFYKTPSDSLPVQLYIKYYLSGDLGNSLTLMVSQSSGSTHIEAQKGFVNQLRLIMGDCKKITDGQWEILDYRIYSLKSLIKNYNKCK